jgi:hypothetical protein
MSACQKESRLTPFHSPKGTLTDVNIVNVVVDMPVFAAGIPTDITLPGARKKNIAAANPKAVAPQSNVGLGYTAHVTLNGPNNNTGITQIRVGFIQNVTRYLNDGTYTKNGVKAAFTFKSTLDGSAVILDMADNSTRPWADFAGTGAFRPVKKQQLVNVATIGSSDTPHGGPLDFITKQPGPGQLDGNSLQFNFELDICAQTQDTILGASKVYVKEYSANWMFNGDGAINNKNAFAWTSDPGAKVTPPTTWGNQIITGAAPVATGDTFNQKAKGEAYIAA